MADRQQQTTLTRKELAEKTGVTPQAVFYWIRTGYGGIGAYLQGKRIDSTILTQEPFKGLLERHRAEQDAQPPAEPAEVEKMRAELADLRAEVEAAKEAEAAAKKQLADAQAANRLHELDIEHKEQTISDLRAEVMRLRSELDTAHRLHAMTLAALPAPRQTIGERLKNLFHKPKQDQTQPEE